MAKGPTQKNSQKKLHAQENEIDKKSTRNRQRRPKYKTLPFEKKGSNSSLGWLRDRLKRFLGKSFTRKKMKSTKNRQRRSKYETLPFQVWEQKVVFQNIPCSCVIES